MEFGRCGRREMGKDRGRREKQCVNKKRGCDCRGPGELWQRISSSENQNAKIAVGSVAPAT